MFIVKGRGQPGVLRTTRGCASVSPIIKPDIGLAGLIWISLAFLLAAGCATNTKSTSSGKVSGSGAALADAGRPDVLVVAGETITYSDIVGAPVSYKGKLMTLQQFLAPIARTSGMEDFRQYARPKIEQKVNDEIKAILLYQRARRQWGEKLDKALDKAADREFRKLVMGYGGDQAKAEEALKQAQMTREAFKEQKKRAILTQYYVNSRFPQNRPITYGELTETYNQLKDELFVKSASLQFRLIDIDLTKVRTDDPAVGPLDHARNLAKQLIKRIEAGEDFAELAKQYSDGYRRDSGGLWKPRDPDSLASPYDILAVEAEKIQPGQVAGPVETLGHIFVMKLEERTPKGYEPLGNVQAQLEQIIIADRQEKTLDMLNAEVMQQAAIADTDGFLDFCLEQIYLTSTQRPTGG